MFDNAQLGPEVLTNPGILQSIILTELNNRLNGVYSIADPNNGFNYMLEAGSSMVAASSRYMEGQFESLYPARAVTSQQLYKQMSDFDYLQMVSQPALTSVRMMFDSNYLIQNAIPFNNDYNLIVIPAETIFYIGSLVFGMYYPIQIRINKTTNNIVVVYDDSVPNPLFTLASNTVEYVVWPFQGLQLLTITFPVYQFAAAFYEQDVIVEQGFQQVYTYTDNFYAARVYTNINGTDSNGNPIWTEMAYTLSEVYDVTVPTVKLLLLEDEQTINITIPQIYFTNNQIGNKIKIVIYTTKGSISVNLTAAEVTSCNCDFNLTLDTTTQYSTLLAKLPTLILQPTDVTIVGGSNALTFSQLRERIVNGSLYDAVPITPQDIENFVNKNGFTLTRYLDNITDRIYYAGKTMQGGANTTVPVVVANVIIDTTKIGTTKSIVSFDDGSITVFPTTLYSYNTVNGVCTPLTDAQVSSLAVLTADQLCATLNNSTYTQHPYHFVTYTNNPYPLTKTFNLMNPSAINLQFIEENVDSSAQLTLVSANVQHLAAGTGGYLIQLAVLKTSEIQALPESEISVIISTLLADNTTVYFKATWFSSAPPNSAYTDIYNISIPTTYQIAIAGTFSTQYTFGTTTIAGSLSLSTLFDVKFLVNQSAFPDVEQDFNIIANLDPSLVTGMLGIVHQQITVVFGTDLSNTIFTITDVTFGQQTYMMWPENTYETYPEDVYATLPNGALNITVTNGQPVLNKLHSKGDQVLDTNGNPIIKNPAGSLKLDGYGNPIPLGTRNALYYIQTMQFDARLFQSQNPTDVSYINQLTAQINSYVDTIETLQQELLEQTNLYFLPANTIGTANYNTGNGQTITLPLGLSFSFQIYIPNYDPSNLTYSALTALITTQVSTIITSALQEQVISMTSIANTIMSTFPDISSIDCLGINGNIALQTLQVASTNSSPSIGLILVHNLDGTVTLNQNITLTFVNPNPAPTN